MNNLLPEEGPDSRLGGAIPFGQPINSLPATVTLEKGKKDELVKIFTMFDRFQPAKNVTVPSLDDITHMFK